MAVDGVSRHVDWADDDGSVGEGRVRSADGRRANFTRGAIAEVQGGVHLDVVLENGASFVNPPALVVRSGGGGGARRARSQFARAACWIRARFDLVVIEPEGVLKSPLSKIKKRTAADGAAARRRGLWSARRTDGFRPSASGFLRALMLDLPLTDAGGDTAEPCDVYDPYGTLGEVPPRGIRLHERRPKLALTTSLGHAEEAPRPGGERLERGEAKATVHAAIGRLASELCVSVSELGVQSYISYRPTCWGTGPDEKSRLVEEALHDAQVILGEFSANYSKLCDHRRACAALPHPPPLSKDHGSFTHLLSRIGVSA